MSLTPRRIATGFVVAALAATLAAPPAPAPAAPAGAADTFANKLKEVSKGAMIIDQFPGAQLGQEPQVLQKLRTGDVDFAITSTANSATV